MRWFSFLLSICFIIMTSCNNNDKKHEGHKKDEPKTQADSLMADIMDGHDIGMAKYSKLQAMEKKIKSVRDSISKLPAKAKMELTPYKARLDSTAGDLSYAIIAMDKWMEEFNMDSAVNNAEERIKYLLDEKMKVGKVKDAILKSLSNADSLLKARY